MLERGALLGRGDAGQRLEAGIDLQRVGGDGDRVLAACAQALGERDGDSGLADRGRAEQGDDLRLHRA